MLVKYFKAKYCKGFIKIVELSLSTLFLIINFNSNSAHAQVVNNTSIEDGSASLQPKNSMPLEPIIAPSNYIYSALEVGDYKNYCEYGDHPFFLPDANRFLINIDSKKATTSDEVFGCWPVSYNSNGIFNSQIKMDLISATDTCPAIDLQEILPAGMSTEVYKFMNITPQSFYHRSAATYYVPRLSLAFSKGNSCYYNYGANFNQGQDNNKEYMAYFLINAKQLDHFVKGDKYAERYAGRFVPGASWEGSTIDEATKTYYKLPKMELTSLYTTDQYNIITDFNMNKGKYISTTTLAQSNKQELDNIAFFPGLLGSQLRSFNYNPILGNIIDSNNNIWPSFLSSTELQMKVNNPSQIHNSSLSYPFDPHVYTFNDIKSDKNGGVTRTVDGIDIYDTFLKQLETLKSGGEMADYGAVPYDFRMFTDDIYCNGYVSGVDKVSYDTQSYGANSTWPWDCRNAYVYGELKRLALTSKTGKITLIGHSYGGLVIKELLKQLEDSHDSLLSKIDKVILIAVPQAGAPESIANMLHGKNVGNWGKPLNAQTVRELSITFPSAYELLPSDDLMNKLKNESGAPMIKFSNKSMNGYNGTTSPYFKQYNTYGSNIDNNKEVADYINNKDGREKPKVDDLSVAEFGYDNLLKYAKQRRELIDNYVPTSTIEIHQIAGWGIPTDIGYTYDYIDGGCIVYTTQLPSATSSPTCAKYGVLKQLNVIHSTDGDDTVPTASALWMDPTTHPNVHNWWVDLAAYRTINFVGRTHKDILTASVVENKISDIVRNKNTYPILIYNHKPSAVVAYQKVSLHSPVNLSIVDKQGNRVGYSSSTQSVVDNIPGIYYEQVGDTKMIIAPTDMDYTINLEGYTSGVYAIDLDKYNSNDMMIASTTYFAIPTASSSFANIVHTAANGDSPLVIDLNGNGKIDAIITASSSPRTYSTSSAQLDTVSIAKYVFDILNPVIDTPFSDATSTNDGGPTARMDNMPTIINTGKTSITTKFPDATTTPVKLPIIIRRIK